MNEIDPASAAAGTSGIPAEERQWAMFAHLSALLGGLLTSAVGGWGFFIGPLVIWLMKKETMPFVADQAKEALNFNLSMFLYAAIAAVLAFVLVGATVLTLGLGIILTAPAGIVLALVILAISLMWLVCSIVAALKAWSGEPYRYPMTVRLVK